VDVGAAVVVAAVVVVAEVVSGAAVVGGAAVVPDPHAPMVRAASSDMVVRLTFVDMIGPPLRDAERPVTPLPESAPPKVHFRRGLRSDRKTSTRSDRPNLSERDEFLDSTRQR
jgi:hypothetical protein